MTSRSHVMLRAAAALGAAMLLALAVWARPVTAHDFPDEMVFYAHVVTDADQLHVPLRVPLTWLVDYRFPLRGSGYIDLADTEGVNDALGLAAADIAADIALFEDGSRLQPTVEAWRLSLPSDRSFDDHREALANIAGKPLPAATNLFWNQGFLDVHFVYPVDEETSTFSLLVVPSALAERLHILTTFVAPDGASRTYDLLGTMGRVELNPGTGYLIRLFGMAGLTNLLTGWEHVLFVVALAVALDRRPASPLRPVIGFGVVASLIVLVTGPAAGAAGLDSTFAELFVAAAAAASLLVLAIGNIMARTLRLRWLTAAVCAVPHGLLLASGLDVILQFREPGEVLPLLAYALGVQAGTATVFAAALGVGWLVTRHAGARRHGPVVAALLIGYVGWRGTLERGEVLLTMPPPPLDLATLIAVGRWAAALMLAVAVLWLAFELFTDRRGHVPQPVTDPTSDAPAGPEPEPSNGQSLDVSGNGQAPTVAAASRPGPRRRDDGRQS